MEIKDIRIEWLGNSGFLIHFLSLNKKIVIDPYNISSDVPKADILLITHNHPDHCSIEDIKKVIKEGSVIICPADVQSKVMRLKGVEVQIIESGDELKLNWISIEGFPAYNLEKKFHPKDEGFLGYVLKYKNMIIYHAGDTDKIPEMDRLTGYARHGNQFIALLPVSGKYVMDSYEAAEVAKMLNADFAIPMHYGSGAGNADDAHKFVELCQKYNIPTRVLTKF